MSVASACSSVIVLKSRLEFENLTSNFKNSHAEGRLMQARKTIMRKISVRNPFTKGAKCILSVIKSD